MERGAPDTGWRGALGQVGSTRVAVVLLCCLGLVCVAVLRFGVAPVAPVSLVCGALAVNLGASLATHPAFRQRTALTVFHLCLVATLAFIALGQLSGLRGQVEVTEGESFRREMGRFEAGPLHWERLDRVAFRNDGFTIEYAPGLKRGPTRNRVSWDGPAGRGAAIVGDQHPLVLEGYRFYTTFNKGYAPVLEWRPSDGGASVAAVLHLPGYPAFESTQEGTIELAEAGTVRVSLFVEEPVLDPAVSSTFRTPTEHHLRLESGGRTASVRLGESLELGGGRVVYAALRTWMGYKVVADWTLPFLAAASAGACGSLLVHVVAMLRAPLGREIADGV